MYCELLKYLFGTLGGSIQPMTFSQSRADNKSKSFSGVLNVDITRDFLKTLNYGFANVLVITKS